MLIVDDHPGMRTQVRLVVEQTHAGPHRFRECGNGAEAVAAYREFAPDAVIMDIAMPVMDGLAATRAIRAEHDDAVIVLMTQWPPEEYAEASREAGAASLVGKEKLMVLGTVLQSAGR